MKSIYPEWKFNERFDLPTSDEEPYSLLVVDGKYHPSIYNEGKIFFSLKGQCSRFPQKSNSVRSARHKTLIKATLKA